MLTAQSPKITQGGTSPLSEVHPISMKTVQHDNGHGSSHTCSPLDHLKRQQATHAIIHPHRFNELATNSGMGNPNWHETLFNTDTGELLQVYCFGHATVKGHDGAERRTSKATIKSGFHLRRSEMFRCLRHYLWTQSQHYLWTQSQHYLWAQRQ